MPEPLCHALTRCFSEGKENNAARQETEHGDEQGARQRWQYCVAAKQVSIDGVWRCNGPWTRHWHSPGVRGSLYPGHLAKSATFQAGPKAVASGFMCSESDLPPINQQFGKHLLESPWCFWTHLPGTKEHHWHTAI